jgi:hypothetical protein
VDRVLNDVPARIHGRAADHFGHFGASDARDARGGEKNRGGERLARKFPDVLLLGITGLIVRYADPYGSRGRKVSSALKCCKPVSRRRNHPANRSCRLPHGRALPPPAWLERHRRPARGRFHGIGAGRPKKRAALGPPPIRSFGPNSTRIIHVELDRVRGHLEAHHLAHFQFDVAVDDIVVENAACLEESAILVEINEGFAQRAADGRDFL